MPLATNMPHDEGGIIVDFPAGAWFQFDKSNLHKAYDYAEFKEMDFGLVDKANKCIYLFELKNFNVHGAPVNLNNSLTDNKGKNRLEELVLKTIHACTLLMVYPKAINPGINGQLNYNPNYELRVYHVINVGANMEKRMGAWHQDLNAKLNKFKNQFGIKKIAVITLTKAQELFPEYFPV